MKPLEEVKETTLKSQPKRTMTRKKTKKMKAPTPVNKEYEEQSQAVVEYKKQKRTPNKEKERHEPFEDHCPRKQTKK